MPRIELISVPLHNPNDPYHFEFDNLPLKALKTRQELINGSLDNLISQMRDAIGTQNTVANRLNQSINPNGSLRSEAIDEALHSIEEHEDTDDYVRMTKLESDKLELVAPGATDITLLADSVELDSGEIAFESSTSISVDVESPNIIRWNLAFDPTSMHQHFYSLIPVDDNITTPDYINYKVNSISSAFISGSLRVFINGIRLFSDQEVYAPGALVDDPWTLLQFTPNAPAGTFALSSAISNEDIIRIDFDISFV